MPAEWSPHRATVMIFPQRAGTWIYGGEAARRAFAAVIEEIARGEKVYVAVNPENYALAKASLKAAAGVEILKIVTDDSWARDVAPTFVFDGEELCGIDWRFNAWGGESDGLYADYLNDDKFASALLKKLKIKKISARPFVLEGGSVHTDGAGALITTEECLLSAGRNPELTRRQIENRLKKYLGVNRVIWLPYGICGDETNGHVDNICAFVGKNKAVLGWTDEGQQGERCRADLAVLQAAGVSVVKLPLPAKPVALTSYEAAGYVYAEGEARRSAGEKLAASYVNFYVCNAAVIVPQFGDVNDALALEIMGSCFKDKKIVGIPARDILLGGGNIHCITQQIPEGKDA